MNKALLFVFLLFFVGSTSANTCACLCYSNTYSTAFANETTVSDCKDCNGALCLRDNPLGCLTSSVEALCTSSSLGSWSGKFKVVPDSFKRECNQTTCCCPEGTIELTQTNNSHLHLSSEVNGYGCPGNKKIDADLQLAYVGRSIIVIEDFLGWRTPLIRSDSKKVVFLRSNDCGVEASAPSGSSATVAIVIVVIIVIVIILIIIVVLWKRKSRQDYTAH
eukprot:TRINITY_DN801_c0_g1_i1.p1 TRINITY_DN801_c0_g1~~TRINITY_DN801_c0_g1_i1.p1  ORF type:complete len:220 (+),score=24.33 TRINITY_DN801_c0_g1_i1:720-1379(+)